MPRHPLKADLVNAIRDFAKLDDSFITELSYQTETKKVWISITKGDKTIEDSIKPEAKNIIRQIGGLLKLKKESIIEDKKLSDYIDTTITLPDKPNQAGQTK